MTNSQKPTGGCGSRALAGILLAVGGLGICALAAGLFVLAQPQTAASVLGNNLGSPTGTPTLVSLPIPPQGLPTAPGLPAGSQRTPGAASAATPQFSYSQPPPASLRALVSTDPLLPANLGQAATTLTDAIEALNAAEWRFTQDAAKASAAGQDDELRAVAAQALVTARLAQKIAASTQNQGVPQHMLDEYNAIARLGYALVIESQNVRTELAAGATTPAAGASRIGALAARLITPRLATLTGSENPFAAYLPAGSLPVGLVLTQAGYDKFLGDARAKMQFEPAPLQWISGASQHVELALHYNVAALKADLNAPGVPVMLMSAGGQADADLARMYAGAQLVKLGATSKTGRAGGLASPSADTMLLAIDGPALINSLSKKDIPGIINGGNKVINNDSFVTWGPGAIAAATGLDPNGLPIQTAITVMTSTQVKAAGTIAQVAVDQLAKILSASIGINVTDPSTDDSIVLSAVVVNGLRQTVPPDSIVWIVDGNEYFSNKKPLTLGQMPAGAHYANVTVDLGAQGKAYAGTFFSVRQKNLPDGTFATSLVGGGGPLHDGDTATFVATYGNQPAGAQIAYEWFADGAKRDETGNTLSYVLSGPGTHWVSVTAVDTNSGARAATVGATFEVLGSSVDAINTATAQAAALQTAAAQQTALAQLNADATATAVEAAYQAAVQTATAQALAANQTATAQALAANQTAAAQALAAIQTATALALAAAKPPPVPTFVPVVIDTFFAPGNRFAAGGKVALNTTHRYQVCFSGVVNLINPTHAAPANELMHVFGIKVPGSECVVLPGNGSITSVSCGSGTVDNSNPGGYSVTVTDLGPR